MKIKIEKGKKFEGDNIIKITTKEMEVFHLRRLLLVINQIALNEQKRYEKAPDNKENLWFCKAVKRFLEDGYNYVDLLDDKNNHLLDGYAKLYKINGSFKQTKIEDFENGNTG